MFVSMGARGWVVLLTADTVVDADEGNVVQQRQSARDQRANLERCAHTGT